MKKTQQAWITWEIQTRNRSMASALNIPLYELISNKGRILRYIELTRKTLKIIKEQNVSTLYVQNPSIVLAFISIVYRLFSGIKVIVDAHNAGVFPNEGRSAILTAINNFIIRHATLVIVTNAGLKEEIERKGGKAEVIPDPLPNLIKSQNSSTIHNRPYALFICTWAADEPYFEVIEAANSTPDFDILITGKYSKALSPDQIKTLPGNIKLLGFVPEEDYIDYLSGAFIAIDLTTRENCLVCGAYEAAAVLTPGLLTDSTANRELFTEGYLFTNCNTLDIAATLISAYERRDQLRQQIESFREFHQSRVLSLVQELKQKIN